MKIPFVDLHAQYLGLKAEIDEAIASVIAGSEFIRGSHLEPFEEEFCAEVGSRFCISCANGTDALYIAMKALGTGAGEEVITTAHSWISTSETITQAGARVVFCDTEEDSFNIHPDLIESKITDRTKGIIAVHLCGQPAKIDKIRNIADKHGLWLIEDCAQAHLAKLDGKTVGTFGDIATFSFYPGKNLGAMGDAGGIVTDREDLADWMRLYARHGGKGEHLIEGINSRMDGLQAAILRVKLPHLREWTKKRQAAASNYDSLLTSLSDVVIPVVGPGMEHVYHLYMIKIPHRDLVRSKLSDRGIPTVINYGRALPFYEAYKYLGHKPSDFPAAAANQERILSLPLFPEITKAEQDYVVEQLEDVLQSIR
ncbi:DegT/DnrJ/EryC1/StrS family aminotransferase [Verrucomicrobia bacterium]|nr:DegT/DnrJ/EryC1/StrS family aminotransferase [Verrucomicrobiota bacterium]